MKKALDLIDIELHKPEIPRFGKRDEFTTWFSKVGQAITCYSLVTRRIRGGHFKIEKVCTSMVEGL